MQIRKKFKIDATQGNDADETLSCEKASSLKAHGKSLRLQLEKKKSRTEYQM